MYRAIFFFPTFVVLLFNISNSEKFVKTGEIGIFDEGFKKLNVITQTKKEKQDEDKKFIENATKKRKSKK